MSQSPPIYLDHQATTPVDPRVLEAMLPYYKGDFGNASSATHAFGWRAEAAVEDARERIAQCLAVDPNEIVFTSGATESNNLAIHGALNATPGKAGSVVATAIEHPSVLEAATAQRAFGHRDVQVPVAASGLVDPSEIAAAIEDDTTLVSVSAANSEIGVLPDIAAIAVDCHERGVLFHTDAAQAIGKIPLSLADTEIDLLSFSAHKIYGPKGIGALYVRRRRPRIKLRPLVFGGGQEGGLRSGTLAVPLIVGFARALELCVEEQEGEAARLRGLREKLRLEIERSVPEAVVNGDLEHRLPGNLSVSIPDVDGERLLLDLRGLAVSSGSACSSGSGEPSHVLLALGRDKELARATVRFGLGRGTAEAEIAAAAGALAAAVRKQNSR
ncbi:MAG: cysteine desulfurase family protein [Myxococcota bacterium]|jgi:cysteine desulfurase|nr:cysteine desulfurase family protein [Myxococcota bacterium]